ncbi:hypothetical protein [Microbacterium deminutum]|uniref:Uncharacterized protein n=1 Tax=Microbacterium deminutum TaxID=344164 RepID=A0ABP5BUH3_9MICO
MSRRRKPQHYAPWNVMGRYSVLGVSSSGELSTRCPDCNSETVYEPVARGALIAHIQHDATCPTWAHIERNQQ